MSLRWLWFDHFPSGLTLSRKERLNVRRRARELRRDDSRAAEAERRSGGVFRSVALLGLGALLTFSWFSDWVPWHWLAVGCAVAPSRRVIWRAKGSSIA